MRWFVGKFDGRLQEVDGKLGVALRGDPHSKALMDVLGCGDRLQELVQEVQAQMTVLQEQPPSIGHALGQEPAGMDLLTLSHGDGSARDSLRGEQAHNCVRWL